MITIAFVAVKATTPGPGTYKEQNDLSAEGRYVMSSHKNVNVPSIKRTYRPDAEERVFF